MPTTRAMFVGHGSPMNAILDNTWTKKFKDLGASLAAPRAILAISAHWYTPGTFVTAGARPATIHDFGGFPRELYEIQYPAAGDDNLVRRVTALLAERQAGPRSDWGLDHGTWTVLHHLRPKADVPVVQLSIDHRLPAAAHLEIGRALAPLRDEGIMIFGSGNITHNLRLGIRHWQTGDRSLLPGVHEFDADIARALEQHDDRFLTRAPDTTVGHQHHPTPEHYLPLLYVAGAAGQDAPRFFNEGFDLGAFSMRGAIYG